jgi:light-regulated signal transduction histidine kinase (bacteriophytochrome)
VRGIEKLTLKTGAGADVITTFATLPTYLNASGNDTGGYDDAVDTGAGADTVRIYGGRDTATMGTNVGGQDTLVVDWSQIAREVALDVAPLIADKGLEFDFDAHTTPVRAHRWMLQELTRNLLHNAIKHSPPGGRLHVALHVDADDAVLSVADDGPGIPAELRQRLFAPFAAGDVANGSGLGLAICREIVQALDGRIALDDRPADNADGGGLTAIVRLPSDNRH